MPRADNRLPMLPVLRLTPSVLVTHPSLSPYLFEPDNVAVTIRGPVSSNKLRWEGEEGDDQVILLKIAVRRNKTCLKEVRDQCAALGLHHIPADTFALLVSVFHTTSHTYSFWNPNFGSQREKTKGTIFTRKVPRVTSWHLRCGEESHRGRSPIL